MAYKAFVQDATKMAKHGLCTHSCGPCWCFPRHVCFICCWLWHKLDKEVALWLHHCLWQKSLETGCCSGKQNRIGWIHCTWHIAFPNGILGSPTLGPKLLECHKVAHGIGFVQLSILPLVGKLLHLHWKLSSLGKPGTHGGLCISTRLEQENWNYFLLFQGRLTGLHQCGTIWKNILLLQCYGFIGHLALVILTAAPVTGCSSSMAAFNWVARSSGNLFASTSSSMVTMAWLVQMSAAEILEHNVVAIVPTTWLFGLLHQFG